jgi:hypothetical protein
MGPVRLAAAVLTAILSACPGPESARPASSTSSISGTWVGAVSEASGGHAQSARLVLQHNGTEVSGTYSPQFWGTSGNLYGTTSIDGTMIDFTLNPTAPSCSGTLTGTGGVAAAGDGTLALDLEWWGQTSCLSAEHWVGRFVRQ